MIIIVENGRARLEQPHDFKSFKVRVPKGTSDASIKAGLGALWHATGPDAGTVWISEPALRSMPDVHADQTWQENTSRMIEKVKPFGWIDDATGSIRAHIEVF